MNTEIPESYLQKHIIFYDGDCGFCHKWVQWILQRDVKDEFLFASLQSNFGQKFLSERGLNTKNFDTLYLWKPNEFYMIKSQAATKIGKLLGSQYALLAQLNILPRFLGDQIYDQIAKRRKAISDPHCIIPSEKDKRKMIS